MLRLTFLLTATALALPALADTHITYVDDGGQPSSQIYVKGDKVRMDSGDKEHTVTLYDVANNSITVLMPGRKQYMVFDQRTAAQMGAQMSAAQQQMQAGNAQMQAAMQAHQAQIDQAMQGAMAKMSPEQRAQMQQMMGAQGAQAQNPMAAMQGAGGGFETKDLGTSETIAGHRCKDIQMMMGSRPISTACVLPSLASLGIPGADLRTLDAMRDGMKKLVSQMGPMAQGMSAMMDQGFALKTTRESYQGYDRVTVTDTFKSVSTGGLSSSLFQIPRGYTETNMQGMMQGGHP